MDKVRGKPKRRISARFTRPEVRRLEMLLQEGKDELSDPKFYQKLADEFNAQGRIENKNVQMQQVQRWFQSRLNIEKTVYVSSPSSSQDTDPTGDDDLPNNALQCIDLPKGNYVEISEGLGMEFEAKSYRDQAWYDVSTFLAHRVLSSGEVEVRVRFAGFGPEEDEWVDAAKAVRDRSIPMEASECWRVNEGDILLCFREKDEAAYHFDACVVSISRNIHDARGCRCTFFMRYVHDQVEEIVHLNQLCRRP